MRVAEITGTIVQLRKRSGGITYVGIEVRSHLSKYYFQSLEVPSTLPDYQLSELLGANVNLVVQSSRLAKLQALNSAKREVAKLHPADRAELRKQASKSKPKV